MDDFELPVQYKDKELLFNGRLLAYGYSYKIEIEVNGQPVLFEPDEERNWRALVDPEQFAQTKIEHGLIEAMIAAIEKITQ